MSSPFRSNWRSIRRGIILLLILMGGMSLVGLALGRPDYVASGLIGGVVGGTAGAVALAIEFMGTWLVRRGVGPTSEPPASGEAAPASSHEP